MAPSKLIIVPWRCADPVMFNPNQYRITKSVAWSTPSPNRTKHHKTTERHTNAPPIDFDGGHSRQLDLQLFFDTTEEVLLPLRDVRRQTDRIVQLTRIQRKKARPPVCIVLWGPSPSTDFPFKGVITNLTQTFVLFDHSGSRSARRSMSPFWNSSIAKTTSA